MDGEIKQKSGAEVEVSFDSIKGVEYYKFGKEIEAFNGGIARNYKLDSDKIRTAIEAAVIDRFFCFIN